MVGDNGLWEKDNLNNMLVIVCPLVPKVIFLRRLVYNKITGDIEEQGVFSLRIKFWRVMTMVKFPLVGLLLDMAEIWSLKRSQIALWCHNRYQ